MKEQEKMEAIAEMCDATREEGYAWAESRRNESDLRAVIDWCTREIPDNITPEFLAREEVIYERLRKAFDNNEELERLLLTTSAASDEYREAWVDGVIAFYQETRPGVPER